MILATEARHVGIAYNVPAVPVVARRGNIHPDFVQERAPADVLEVVGRSTRAKRGVELLGDVGDTDGLFTVDLSGAHHAFDCDVARVFVAHAPEQVVKEPDAKRARGRSHRFDAERFVDGEQHGQSASNHLFAVFLEAIETDVLDVFGFEKLLANSFEMLERYRSVAPA